MSTPDGHHFYQNEAFNRLFGYTLEEVSCLHPIKLYGNDDVGKKVFETIMAGRSWQGEIEMVAKNGRRFPASLRADAIKDENGKVIGLIGVHTDITERKLAEEALSRSREIIKESEQTAKALINAYPDSAFLIDRDGIFLAVNETVARRLKKPVGELLQHQCVYDFMPADFAVSGKAKVAEAIQSKNIVRFVHQQGEGWVDNLLYPILDEHKNVARIAVYSQNITRQKKAEAELAQHTEQLARYAAELEERNKEINALSHMADFLQSCKALDEAYAVIAESVSELFPGFSGALYMHNPSRDHLDGAVFFGKNPPEEKRFSPDDCWSLRRGKINLVKDSRAALQCRHVEAIKDVPYLCIPMVMYGETLGVFHIRGLLPESKLPFLEHVTDRVGMALANIKLHETLRGLSIRDHLTGLYNRRFMEESIERELIRAERKDMRLGIIMLDIDHFKSFNDRFGHDVGDSLLKALGNLLQQYVRGSDIACRYGGEEFIIVLPDSSLDISRQRAEYLREAAKNLRIQHGQQSWEAITVSFGIAVFPDHGSSAESVVHAADMALYQAKQEGRDRVCVAPPLGE
jgi:diguanylate cyclase (GGDEF)-like protein/PAS domain S-box-containing protein